MAEKATNPKRKARPGLEDPFKHAPPKPDGDLWAILLKPEIEADKMRCDAWKEEVEKLLIFAGLFSAVVTAFVIESYKLLQPDPNDTIISLLSQIANSPNATSSLSASTSTSMAFPFVQKPSSVRMNVFWFISLILSLTTVLVGTIALQWLREHQSYPGLSPKETLAMLHMRTEALGAWYVPQIFAALPLLLQGALVLFLAGLIDFTLPLGVKLTVPVACIVGLVLLFLAATTALPAFQPLFLFSGYFSRNTVPTPCAFKSPQSQVFRTLIGFFLRLLSFTWPIIYRPTNKVEYHHHNIIPEESGQRHLFPYIYTIWHRKTWPVFDSEWLSLRDAWHQGIFDKDVDLYGHRYQWKEHFPLSDITQCLTRITAELTSAKHTEEYLVAACYCFHDISASVWKSELTTFGNRPDRRNNYFEKIYQRHSLRACSVSKFLIHGGQYKYDALVDHYYAVGRYFAKHRALFYLDQVYLFFDMLLKNHSSTAALRRYRLEIQSRTIQHLLTDDIKTSVPTLSVDPSCRLTVFNLPYTQCENEFMTLFDSVDLLATILETVTFDSHTEDDHLTNPVYKNTWAMPEVIDMLAGGIISYLHTSVGARDLVITDPETFDQQDFHDIGERYSSMFRSVATYLSNEIASEMSTPSLLFEFSAMLLQRFLYRVHYSGIQAHNISCIKDSFRTSLSELVVIMERYKQHMGGQNNDSAEIRFKGNAPIRARRAGNRYIFTAERFSEVWWTALFFDYENSSLSTIQTCPTVPSPTSLDIASQPSIPAPGETQPSDIMPSSPPATSLHSRSQNTTHTIDSSSPPSHPDMSHIPSPPLDPQVEQTVEHPTGADTQVPTSSSHSPPETLARSNDRPDTPTTTCDSIIDIQLPR